MPGSKYSLHSAPVPGILFTWSSIYHSRIQEALIGRIASQARFTYDIDIRVLVPDLKLANSKFPLQISPLRIYPLRSDLFRFIKIAESADGKFLSPLPPDWQIRRECPDFGNHPGRE